MEAIEKSSKPQGPQGVNRIPPPPSFLSQCRRKQQRGNCDEFDDDDDDSSYDSAGGSSYVTRRSFSLNFITTGIFLGSIFLAGAYLFDSENQRQKGDRHSWILWGSGSKQNQKQHVHSGSHKPTHWTPYKNKKNQAASQSQAYSVQNSVPQALLQAPIQSFHETTFINDAGVAPTYWEHVELFKTMGSPDQNNTSGIAANLTSRFPYDTWGPCFVTKDPVSWSEEWHRYQEWQRDQWSKEKKKTTGKTSHSDSMAINDNTIQHNLPEYHKSKIYRDSDRDVRGYCRPGFVILGAGKCGTSSLYHYLTEHPQVLPAKEKQIHYFKYFKRRSMAWYLSHFPTAINMMVSGSLMTGEASPGYLPYPDVANLMPQRMPGTRLIVLGRDPLERTYSSFMYSYIYPHLELMHRGGIAHVPAGLTEKDYLENYLFTFEETIEAELKVLQSCLAQPHGSAIEGARNKWGRQSIQWGPQAYAKWDERQKLKGNSYDNSTYPMLADLDGFCYGKEVNDTVLRPQWAELQMNNRQKVILDKNTHLLQSHLGRSIYVLPLEWWYTQYRDEDIYFVCTEELKDLTGQAMKPLRQWLGLPQFNFSAVLQQGAFNVGGHGNAAYDKETSWDKALQNNSSGMATEIPISSELRKRVLDFLEPYNERLYDLVGKRCQW